MTIWYTTGSKKMKSKIINLIVLSIVLCLFEIKVNAQNGCDLCGPASGTAKNVASGMFSATIGAACESRGLYSFAVGYVARAMNTNAIAMGKNVKAMAANSMVIGTGSSSTESRMLINNVSNSLMIGFNSALPTLFITKSSAYNTTGKVGIGNVTSPQAKLHIKSDSNEDAGLIVEPANMSKMAYIQLFDESNRISVHPNSGLSIKSQNAKINLDAKQVLLNAQVTINAPQGFSEENDYALAVPGGILTTKVLVKDVEDWYDIVFEENYKLLSIEEIRHYIRENGHLPDIPSGQDIFVNGYDMVEMDGLLLKKIEELTLYTIELNDLIKRQQEIIDSLLSK